MRGGRIGLCRWLLITAVGVAAACGGPGARDLVTLDKVPGDTSDIRIHRVVDLGDQRFLPARGPLPQPDSDERFAIGELMLIEGEGFGKLPTVRVGGQPMEVLARTASGGIVGRVPPRIDAGPSAVEVSHPSGSDRTSVEVVRYGLVVDHGLGMVHVVSIGPGARATGVTSMPIEGAQMAAISPDGQAAYVATDPADASRTAQLAVLVMTASGGPRYVRSHNLPLARVSTMAVAPKAKVAVVAGGERMLVLDLGVPHTPSIGVPVPLVGDARAIALSPDGTLMTALSPYDNELTPVRIEDHNNPSFGVPIDLWPEQRAPLAADLTFSPHGDQTWVLLGDNATSIKSGSHPTRLVTIAWRDGQPSIERTSEVAEIAAPMALAVGSRSSIGSAAAIRSTAKPTPIVVSGMPRTLWSKGSGDKVPVPDLQLGKLVITDLDGHAEVMASARELYGRGQISHDLAWSLSPTVRVRGDSRKPNFDVGLWFHPLPEGPRNAKPVFVRLGDTTAAGASYPPQLALVP